MRALRHLWYLLRNLFGRRRVEARLDSELTGYLDQLIDEKIAAGADVAEARRLALAEMGGLVSLKDHVRDARAGAWIEQSWRDFGHAWRLLRRSPAFSTVAILTLALGIGANTAIFQLLDAVLLRPLPVANAHELVQVQIANMDGARGNFETWHPAVTHPIWEQLNRHREPFAGLFAWGGDSYNLAMGGEIRVARVLWVSGDLFRTLGITPAVGRLFSEHDDRPGCGDSGVVISDSFWHSEYGGAPGVLDRTITLAQQTFPVVGVTPPSFFGLEVGRGFDLALPICAEPRVRRDITRLTAGTVWWLSVVGRLKPDWSPGRATAYLSSVSPLVFRRSLPSNYPTVSIERYLGFTVEAQPGSTGISALRGQYSAPLQLLLAIAGLVLLIACANIANLMLARASAREREMAIRLAIGASRARLIRQLLMQSLALSATGAGVGLLLSAVLTRFLVSFLDTPGDPLLLNLAANWRVLGFAAGLAMLTCVIFGVVPALRAAGANPTMSLATVHRRMSGGRAHANLRRALVVSQVALSFVLVVTALLFGTTLRNLATVPTGIQPEGILIANTTFRRLNIPESGLPAFKARILERLRAIPGVTSAAEVGPLPLSGSGRGNDAWIEATGTPERHNVTVNAVGTQYFRTVGTALVAGREFDDRDAVGSPKMAIVNEAFARQFLNGSSPVGKRLHIEATPSDPETTYEIVGLTKDAKHWNLREDFPPVVFLGLAQERQGPSDRVMLRSALPMTALIAAVKSAIAEVHPQVSFTLQVFTDEIRRSLLRERLMALLSAFFGLLAALLATLGLYGVVSYMVARRRIEIGVRMALGARRFDVVTMVLHEGAVLVGLGLLIGAGLGLLGARMSGTLLFGVTAHDPATFVTAAVGLALVALLASYAPAARAARLDPTITLRSD